MVVLVVMEVVRVVSAAPASTAPAPAAAGAGQGRGALVKYRRRRRTRWGSPGVVGRGTWGMGRVLRVLTMGNESRIRTRTRATKTNNDGWKLVWREGSMGFRGRCADNWGARGDGGSGNWSAGV